MSDFDKAAINFYTEFYGKEKFYSEKNEFVFSHNNTSIAVSGDVCFNLAIKNGKFYSMFGSLLKDEDAKLVDCLEKQLNKFRYLPMNISIMPRTGGLNNIKKGIGNERFDTFIWLLNQYYNDFTVLILNAGAINMNYSNREILQTFLSSYKDVYEYVKDIYGIDDDLFTNKLIESGSKPITDKAGYLNYIRCGIEFWKKREEKIIQNSIKKSHDDNKEIFDELIKGVKKFSMEKI